MTKLNLFILFSIIFLFPLLLFSQKQKSPVPNHILKKSNLQLQLICNQVSLENVGWIIPILDSVLDVECLSDKSNGSTFQVNSEKYRSSVLSIFNVEFIQTLKEVTNDKEEFLKCFVKQMGNYYFILNVQQSRYDQNGILDEFSRLFKFKWDGNKLALENIFCAG